MALYLVGDYIKETRMRKGYTQEEVSFGICTTASLSRIENGLQIPGRFILDKLLERLGIENNVFNAFVSKEEMEFYETVQNMSRNIADEDIDELEKQIVKMEKINIEFGGLEKQWLLFAKAEVFRKRGADSNEVKRILMEAIHITMPAFNGKTPLESNLLTYDEILIINSIAIQYSKEGKFIEALRLDMWLKEYMEEKIIDGKMKMTKYPVIIYDMSNWLGKVGRYEEALEIAEAGIDYCIKFGKLVVLPLLVFNKACALAELGNINKAKKYFTQSIVIFETMKQYDKAKMATDWCKNNYNIIF